MRLSVNWLKEYVDFDLSPDQLAHELTMLGLEIEAIERPGAEINGVLVGQILAIDPHPDADKLVVCKTQVGQAEPLQIVCGAKNMKVGDRVPTALVGATLSSGLAISRRKMRGIESQGMMCSARELGLGDEHEGLLILDDSFPVGSDATQLLGLDDTILRIEITPNRGDWAGMIGIARELSALFHVKQKLPEINLIESEPSTRARSSVTIEAPDLCPRYAGRVLTDARIGPSPLWMRQRLISSGQRLINNLVDVTNYVLLETGHPLHAFDLDKLAESRIVVRRARHGETLETIDGHIRDLTPDMLVIADAEKPVAIAGVMGGRNTEVGDSTRDIFLESAYFAPKSVRRTSRALGLQTEASARFQRGADPEMARYAVDRAAALMQQVAGAKVSAGVIDEYPQPRQPIRIELRYARTDSLLGTSVLPESQREILVDLGFAVTESGPAGCRAEVPSWRHDVSQEADLIEEVARLHGYSKVNTTLPAVRRTECQFAPQEATIRALKRFLAQQGLTEIINMSFSSPASIKKAGLPDTYLEMVALQNPLSENQATLRSSLLPGVLDTVSFNVRHGAAGIAAFEIGPVYAPDASQDLPEQKRRLAIALMGVSQPKHWSHDQRGPDFYDIKGFVEAVAAFFGVKCAFAHDAFGPYQPSSSAQVSIAGEETAWGRLGQVRKDILSVYDLDQPLFVAELDLDKVLFRKAPVVTFATIPVYPPSLRDLAVVVDECVPSGALVESAREAGGGLLSHVNLLDIYTGKQVPAGKKSVALSLKFQALDRTLTDADTDKMLEKVFSRLQQAYKAELR